MGLEDHLPAAPTATGRSPNGSRKRSGEPRCTIPIEESIARRQHIYPKGGYAFTGVGPVPWKSSAQRWIFLAGFVLILAGIVCLVVSDKFVKGWSQDTLDAFGVGFIIGGVVDVLAISSLNSLTMDEQAKKAFNERAAEKMREYNLDAQRLLAGLKAKPQKLKDIARDAQHLLERSNGLMETELRDGLEDVVKRAAAT
jgi:hypothetical protein